MARANNFFLIFVSIFKEKLVYKGLIWIYGMKIGNLGKESGFFF
jgi:hypothetical protein